MAATQAQRAALYANLVDSMGEEAADTLMDQLPPTGWDQMATKEDLAGVELRMQAAFAAAMAEINAKFAETNASIVETNARITETNADLVVEMRKGFAEINGRFAEINGRFAETNASIAETNARITETNAELLVEMHKGFAEAAKERAEIIKSQAKQLYVIVATIAAATISIWIALFTTAAGG